MKTSEVEPVKFSKHTIAVSLKVQQHLSLFHVVGPLRQKYILNSYFLHPLGERLNC